MMKQKDMMQSQSPLVGARQVIVAPENQTTVWCPHCWTQQRAERAVCYRCGAQIMHLPAVGNDAPKAN